jgi:metal-responsive CopG/Arc/MetJ family transcriptional regulator
MGRVNVFLKNKLLDEIDQEAKKEGTTRSVLIQMVLGQHIEAKRREREEKDKNRKKMQEACRKMDALAKKLGEWDPRAAIRKFPDSNLKGDG